MKTLYKVREVSDLYADACIRHPGTGELLLLSLYGRDGAMLQFFAAFSLPPDRGGLREFTLIDEQGGSHSVQTANHDRLDKLTGKLPRGNLFGNLAHAWLFDRDVQRPDRANRLAWGLYPRLDLQGNAVDELTIKDQLWQQVQDLSPVPLASTWRDQVLTMATEGGFVRWLDEPDAMFPPLGSLLACRIELDDRFIEAISAAVKRGDLALPGDPPGSPRMTPHAPQPDQADNETVRPTVRPTVQLELGRVVVTANVDAQLPQALVMACLRRHGAGDWGVVTSDAKRQNDAAVKSGEDRVMSAYPIDPAQPCLGYGDNTVWVITEWDRSVTTVLLPDDY